MDVRKVICLFLCLLLGATMTAQTLQGYVKTLGRSEKKGMPLSGVSVRVRGNHNPTLSRNDGIFSLLLPGIKIGDAYYLQEVRKNNYELNERGIIGRQYAYSDKVPLTIVMVSSAQLQADKQRVEDNAYRAAEKNYNQKLAILEQQKTAGKITLARYHEELQDLQDKLEMYQSMIDGLAEHFAHVDYDELDDNEKAINICIESGDLDQADSLVNSMFPIVDILLRNKQALSMLNHQIVQANGLIVQANEDFAKVLKQQEKDAEHLFQLYVIALARFDFQLAEQYIGTRAELDSTNVEWQFDAAYYFEKQDQLKRSESYYRRALQTSNIDVEKATALNNIGNICSKTLRLGEAEKMYSESLAIYQQQVQNGMGSFEPDIAMILNNMAMFYTDIQHYEESEKLYKEAIDLYRRLAEDASQIYDKSLAKTLNNLASLYGMMQRYLESEEMYKEALTIRRHLAQTTPRVYMIQVAQTLNNLANLYVNIQRNPESEQLYKESIEIYRQWIHKSPRAVESELSAALHNLASLYTDENRYSESETLFNEALAIRKKLVEANPQAYEASLAATLFNLATLYRKTKKFTESEPMYKRALEIYRRLVSFGNIVYEIQIAKTQYYLGLMLLNNKKYSDAIPLLDESVKIFREQVRKDTTHQKEYLNALTWLNWTYSTSDDIKGDYTTNLELLPLIKDKCKLDKDLAGEYADRAGNQSNNCLMLCKYAEAEHYAREGLEADSTKHWIVCNLAAAMLFQGKYSKAESLYRHYKEELKETFLNDLKQYEEKDVIPNKRKKDVEKIRSILEER